MNTLQKIEPISVLNSRAAEQRGRLHRSAVELRSRISQRLDPKETVSEYIVPASGIAALIAFILGYGITGMFTHH
jgi:hypothetical protein